MKYVRAIVPHQKIIAASIRGIERLVVASTLMAIAASVSSIAIASSPGPITDAVVVPAEQLGNAFAAVAEHVRPAVVSVYSEKMVKMQTPVFPFPFGDDLLDKFFGQPLPQSQANRSPKEYRVPRRGMGSGMILDGEGHILTNYHVVAEVDKIKVQLADKRSFTATIIGTDPKSDVAIIKIDDKKKDSLPTVQLGDSDALRVGNLVIAVGAPFGLTQTVTNGIISAKGRSDVGIAALEDFLQTDAPINPGNSGGPLVNMRGEVIGMNSAIATGGGGHGQSAGVGFAIPSNMIKTMLPTLIKGEKIARGVLGIGIQDVTADLAKSLHLPDVKGVLVSKVNKNSPADKGGLKAGDVIIRFDAKEVSSSSELRNLVSVTPPGTQTEMVVIRNGKNLGLRITVGKEQLPEPQRAAWLSKEALHQLAKLGLELETLTPDLARQSGMEGEKGVLVANVSNGSPAGMAGVQVGDVIIEVNRQAVTRVDEVERALALDREQALLLIRRQDANLFLVLPLR